MHAAPEMHWLLLEQVVRHAPVPHRNGLQDEVDWAGQLPWPSQPALIVAVEPLQLGCRQVVSSPGMLQVAFDPLQVPPHRPVPAQAECPDFGAPVMKPQVPGELPLQYSQDPEQARSQQTPSAQLPLRHWVPPPAGHA
jgi:hypothetical protein